MYWVGLSCIILSQSTVQKTLKIIKYIHVPNIDKVHSRLFIYFCSLWFQAHSLYWVTGSNKPRPSPFISWRNTREVSSTRTENGGAGTVISRSVATDVSRCRARWLDWVLQSGRRRRSLSNSAVMSRLADPESGFHIQIDTLYKGEALHVKFLYTWYMIIIHYWPTSLVSYLCSCARCHLAMGLVLPESEDRVITSAHGVEARDRMLVLCPIPLAVAVCPNCYGNHSESDR